MLQQSSFLLADVRPFQPHNIEYSNQSDNCQKSIYKEQKCHICACSTLVTLVTKCVFFTIYDVELVTGHHLLSI